MNKIGSSETIRKTTFYFYNYEKKNVSHKNKINTHFLQWFIGFTEGDGSFIVSNTRLFFIINQKQEKILHIIHTFLGFGKVSKYKTYSRFIVADKTNVDRLISIFNGNLVLQKTNARFVSWLHARNMYTNEKIPYLGKNEFSSFENNAWLSGFIDAEGCFNAMKIIDKRYSLGFRVRLRFILDQKYENNIFYKLQNFLESGVISKRLQVENMFRFTSTSISSHEKLIQYLKKFSLRSFKKVSFIRFTSLVFYIKNRKILPWQNKVLLKVENLIQNISKKS
jgi:hypothetical protein